MTQVVVLNGKQVNFDHQLDWHEIAADVVVYETSAATQIIE